MTFTEFVQLIAIILIITGCIAFLMAVSKTKL